MERYGMSDIMSTATTTTTTSTRTNGGTAMKEYKAGSMGGMKGKKGLKDNTQASKPYKCNAFAAQRTDLGRVNERPMDYRGTPHQAFGKY